MQHSILIAGAGPAGLICAIQAIRAGQKVRIIDKAEGPSVHSKAVGINARTLDLLEPSGLTVDILAKGLKLQHMNFYDVDKTKLASVDFNNSEHRFNFMLSLPQSDTEKLLLTKLKELGVAVEYSARLVHFEQGAAQVEASIEHADGEIEKYNCQYLVGADGAHSNVRKILGVEFTGHQYEDNWSLADVDMAWNYGDISLFTLPEHGVLFAVKIAAGRYRIISNKPNVITLLPDEIKVDEIHWQSDFKVSCRQVKNYQNGRVFLMGDAAHIHSPAGGRGMNLGIEDACIFVELLQKNKLADYNKLRHPAAHKVLVHTNRMFTLAKAANPILRAVRGFILRHVMSKSWFQKRLVKQISGF